MNIENKLDKQDIDSDNEIEYSAEDEEDSEIESKVGKQDVELENEIEYSVKDKEDSEIINILGNAETAVEEIESRMRSVLISSYHRFSRVGLLIPSPVNENEENPTDKSQANKSGESSPEIILNQDDEESSNTCSYVSKEKLLNKSVAELRKKDVTSPPVNKWTTPKNAGNPFFVFRAIPTAETSTLVTIQSTTQAPRANNGNVTATTQQVGTPIQTTTQTTNSGMQIGRDSHGEAYVKRRRC